MHHGSGESGDASCPSMTVIGVMDMPAASSSGGGAGLSNTTTSSQGERTKYSSNFMPGGATDQGLVRFRPEGGIP